MGPPASDELEISIFGPGYGESLLLHVGDNDWLLVDSCVNPRSRNPIALEYLNQIGVDPSEGVKLLIASHWHDDHIRGLSKIVQACKNAYFVFSSALKAREFLTLVFGFGKRSMMETSGVHEFYEILSILGDRKDACKFAIADRLLWRKDGIAEGTCRPCEVHSLSPSDTSVRLALEEIGRLLPSQKEPKRRLVNRRPNHNAVVLSVQVAEVVIILGSDLENTSKDGTGWSVIVDSSTRPKGRGCVLKVPHHGSISSHHQGVWDKMLHPDPIAILSPFVQGKSILPTKSDVKRIAQRTNFGYSTSNMKIEKPRIADRVVEKTVRETVKNIRRANLEPGHIRLRTKIFSPQPPWDVALFGGAVSISSLYKSI